MHGDLDDSRNIMLCDPEQEFSELENSQPENLERELLEIHNVNQGHEFQTWSCQDMSPLN